MKEAIPLEAARVRLPAALDVLAGLADTRSRIAARSQIIWGEHCSECAAPACYSACSFYTPRPDGHCRRFVNGIESIEAPGVPAGGLVRLSLRKWAKLEGRGPVRAMSPAQADARERAAGPVLGLGIPLLARRAAWHRIEADRNASAGALTGLDAFVIEGATLHGAAADLTLTIVPENKSAHALFQTRLTLGPAWSRTVVPLPDIAGRVELSAAHLIQIEPVGEAAGIELLLGLCDFVSWQPGMAPAEAPEPARAAGSAPSLPDLACLPQVPAAKAKVVVWDLDHTVWDGILLDDGAEGVRVRDGVRAVMQELDARGVLQSVASKNNPAEALAALEHHGLRDLMLAPQIGWGQKSQSIVRLAQILNLGVDSFVFIDDQPFERGEVGEALPAVTVLPETATDSLLARPQFDLPVTAESRGRRALYQVEALRAEAADTSGGDHDSFLRTCNLVLSIGQLGPADAERVYELSQRTNQLNVAATRYTREDVAGMAAGAGGLEAWTLRCADRFGDYGLIGFALMEPGQGRIVDFFMSCRVQRKRVEAAFFQWVANRSADIGATMLTVRYRKAARNGPALEMFEGLGFGLERSEEGGGLLVRPAGVPFHGADVVALSLNAPSQLEAV
jgi:FkbH-like protein